jgi:uncharacterized CHY-type Zn-finger protein
MKYCAFCGQSLDIVYCEDGTIAFPKPPIRCDVCKKLLEDTYHVVEKCNFCDRCFRDAAVLGGRKSTRLAVEILS